ncbi:MAG: glycosyltransferase family 39 protein [Pseudomonadota bacterium]
MDMLDRLSSGLKAWLLLLAITMAAAAPGVFAIPALDRDESRFAQASKQMLETGDFIRIRYQDELRNKKPAGIHWLQAASTAAFSDAEAMEIWSYRVPSWIGAGLGTLACFWAGIALVGRRAAFVGAALFGSTILLTSEAHISKTDGVLVFFTTLGLGALARIYLRGAAGAAPGAGILSPVLNADVKRLALLFWLAMGLGFLIKGPVSIMVAGFAAAGVWAWDKAGQNETGQWWRALTWWPGPALFFALWIPWFIAIQIATSGTFVQGAVGKDLADKFTGASEGHAGWPLYQLSHLPVWFFPATLALVPAAVVAWRALRGGSAAGRRRGSDALMIAGALAGAAALVAWMFGEQALVGYPFALVAVFAALGFTPGWQGRWPATERPAPEMRALRFLAAWFGLTWIFFELMPTRLSHYVLPAYPALGLMCGLAVTRMMEGLRLPGSQAASLALFGVGGALFAAIGFPGIDALIMADAAGNFTSAGEAEVMAQWRPLLDYPLGLWWAGVGALVVALGLGAARRQGAAMAAGIAAALVLGWHARAVFLPGQTWVQPTVAAQSALAEVCGLPGQGAACDAPARVQAVGYSEPSYVMVTGTQNLHPPETVVEAPGQAPLPAVYLINLEDPAGAPAAAVLKGGAAASGAVCVTQSRPRFAINYSNGDPVHFIAIRLDAPPCAAASRPEAAASIGAPGGP